LIIFNFWCLMPRHFQQYFSYIMVTSFSGVRSRSNWKEPPTIQALEIILYTNIKNLWLTRTKYNYKAWVTLFCQSNITNINCNITWHCWSIKRKEQIVYFLYLISVSVNEWFLLNSKWAIFKRWWWCPLCIRPTDTLIWTFIELAHRNNSLLFYRSFNSDTLSWFRVNQSLLLLLNARQRSNKYQIL
jgi:hypothetical protein